MKNLIYIAIILVGLASCTDVVIEPDVTCDIEASVIDISTISGCSTTPWTGFVLRTDDGKLYEPVFPMLFCGTPPLPPEVEDNALRDFELRAGQRVIFGYRNTEYLSSCEVGTPVIVTCIQEIDKQVFN